MFTHSKQEDEEEDQDGNLHYHKSENYLRTSIYAYIRLSFSLLYICIGNENNYLYVPLRKV